MSRFDAFASSPLLRSFTPDEVAEIYATGRPVQLERGKTLFRRGEAGDSMFVILAGRVQLIFPTDIQPKVLGPGDFLGELALVSPDHVRTATAIGLDGGTLQVFDQQAFETLLETKPRLLVSLLKWISSYLPSSEQRLTSGLEERNRELEQTLSHLQRTRAERDRQEELARTDELTGLLNRRSMDDELRQLVEQERPEGEALALLLVDLDDFKGINDTYGHPCGDAVLRAVAGILRSSVRPEDRPCRIGGDEFAVIFPSVRPDLARSRAGEIVRRIADGPFEVRGVARSIRVSASLGGAFYEPDEPLAELFARADRALYASKSEGKDRLTWFTRTEPETGGSVESGSAP
jgi:diguanylate cyclase (GGDEF)-like protein